MFYREVGQFKTSYAADQAIFPILEEKLSEVFLGPMLGGGIETWFAYMLAMLVLLIRPQGLFGERIIERV